MTNSFGNPILPSFEYIPDPEVHVFGDRVYIYGSHDEFNGQMYCENDYVTWSAPIDDLSNWQYEGIIYKKTDHKSPFKKGKTNMYAPDVAQGPDGKYYLYYSIADSSIISVAKSDSPKGPFTYYGDVRTKSGKVFGEEYSDYFEFDPAVLVDGDRVFLYSGSGQKANEKNGHPVVGLFVRELETDMLTVKTEPKILMPANDDRQKKNFFEAASVRKFGDWYYLLYMSTDLTGLHYKMSRYPDKNFEYKGFIHSTANNSINDGRSTDDAHIIENNHGSLEEINGDYYVFNHRHTNRSHFSRQVVGDRLTMNEDGTLNPGTYTSQGLRGKPFDELTRYPASMACRLVNQSESTEAPFVTQEALDEGKNTYSFIKEMTDNSLLTYRYFKLPTAQILSLRIRGKADGKLGVIQEGSQIYSTLCDINIDSEEWVTVEADVPQADETVTLKLVFKGTGSFDIESFTFEK